MRRALPALCAALMASACFDFDRAFQDCQDRGLCTDDAGTGGPVTITIAALPDAYVGRNYAQTLTATGGSGAITWSVTQGALPAGLSLSSGGVLSGTPAEPGNSSFTVTATSGGRGADAPLTLAVLPPLQVTTTALPDGYTGQQYSSTIAAGGGRPPYVFAVQGTLPDGLSLSSGGVLSGTPTFAFNGTVTIAARDANSQVSTTPLPLAIYAPPAITTGQFPDGYTDRPYSATVAVVDGKPPYAFSISSGALPAGLTLDPATGAIAGTPAVPASASVTVTATDANGRAANRSLPLGIFAPVTITTATVPDAYTQTSYDVTLARTGGKFPVVWTASSGLPAGISLTTGGQLTGSPSAPGSYSFTVTATDPNARSDTRALTLGAYDLPAITTTALGDGTLNVAYNDQLSGTGGKPPLTWMLGSGALPAGLVLAADGTVSGTPTSPGSSSFLVTVTDANNRSRSSSVTLTVYSALTISTGSLPVGYAGGVPYSANLAAAGGRSPYTWTLVSGSLPSPLTLSSAGTISGTPAAAGTSTFTVRVTDANSNTTTRLLSLGIVSPPSISTASLDDGYIGVPYAASVQAQDGRPPYTFSVSGALPSGLTLDTSTGQLTGTPTSAASANVTVQLTDANGLTASRGYTFGTYATPSVTTTALPDGYAGDAFSQALSSAGGKAPFSWTVSAGAFAAGLSLSSSGVVSGTPAAVQSTSTTVRLSDANGRAASGIVTQQIYAPPSIITAPGDGYVGSPYPSTTLAVNGGKAPYSFSITAGALPAGLTFAGATGTISGTPAAGGAATFTVQVTDANGRASSQAMSLPVYEPPSVTTTALADAYSGASYGATLQGAGGKAPITWSVSAGTLPPGLTLGTGGAFSGSTAAVGTSTFTVAMTDANGRQATRSLTLAVLPALAVTTTGLSDGYVGMAYSTAALAAAGGRAPYTFSNVNPLPPGVTLATSGAFGGTPTAAGPTSFDVRVTDANLATAQRTLTLAVHQPPSITGALADAYQGTSYSGAVSGADGRAPYTFAVTAGALPAGLTLSSGGTITGTPTGTGASSFTLTLTDANGVTATRAMSIESLAPVAVATASLSDGYQGRAYSMTLGGSGGRTPYTFSISAGTLPAGLSLDGGSGLISGTPGAVGSSSVTVRVTDGNGVAATRPFTLPVLAVPSITTVTLPDGYLSSAYLAASLAGTNGRAPYTFSVASGLPPGLSVSSAGAFSGTPGGPGGTYPFTATLTDANGVQATASLQILVLQPLVVGGAALPDGYLTTAYAGTLAASGGKTPYSWSVASGALPSGVSLNPSTGDLTGTPTATGTASFTAAVTDANGVVASGAKSVQTFALPAITTTTVANAAIGAPYSQALAVSGGKASYTWAITAGAPPAGITLGASDGVLSGTTTQPTGPYSFTATVTDANGRTDSQALTLTVVTGMIITTGAILDGYLTLPFSQTLNVSGASGPVTWSLQSGTFPPGLSLSGGGVLSGTPTSAGSYTFTVQAFDGASTVTKTFTQVIYSLPSVDTAALPDAYTDLAYSQTLSGTGGKAPYIWSITAGAPPSGITLNGSSGTLSGQAVNPGAATFTVQITDANGITGTRPLTLTVYAPLVQTSPATLPDGYVARSYNTTITTTGGKAPIAFAVTAGALPAGLSLNAGTGAITGTPTGAPSASTFTITATDQNGRTAPVSHTITVYAVPVITTASPLPPGYHGVAYSGVTLAASGGVAPFSWALSSGALPPGLSLSSGGVIGGTPTNIAGSTATFDVTATDANGVTAVKSFSLTTAAQLAIATATLADGYTGQTYGATLTATGGLTPYTFSISSGALPPGLSLSAGGAISGTPTATGSYTFVAQVRDGNNSQATKSLSITVYTPCSILTSSLGDGYTAEAYGATLAGSGCKTPYTWSITTGGLPFGLTLNGSSGAIGGTPVAAGQANFTITLSDANGTTASAPLSIGIYTLPQVTTPSPLQDGYANQPYSATLAVSGGKGPFGWVLSGGALPIGLTLGAGGTIGPSIGSAVTNGLAHNFTVLVTDSNGRSASKPLSMTTYLLPTVTNTTLTVATEGITYMKPPGVFEQVTAVNGKPPYTFAGTGLPGGLAVSGTGTIQGIPAQSTRGTWTVSLTATDANGRSGTTPVSLVVREASPIRGGGTDSTAPSGSPITDQLTVFIVDGNGNGIGGVGVRVRRNGVEYSPVKQGLTGANGKAHFAGLGLNGTTDTVDITANSAAISTVTLAQVNAALVTLSPNTLDSPPLRAGGAAAFDATAQKLIVTMGSGSTRNPSAFDGDRCFTDVHRLNQATPTATWSRDLPAGLNASPRGRTDAVFAPTANTGNYLFGGTGCDGVPLNDLWRYNSGTTSWTQLNPPVSPSPRSHAAMASDPSGRLVLFGGQLSGGAPTNELWRLDPTGGTWTNLSGTVPPMVSPRYGMGYTALNGQLWICGGYAGAFNPFPVADCFSVDASGNWTSRPSLPSPRALLSLAADPATGRVYAFGGRTGFGGDTNDLLYFDGNSWIQVTPSGAQVEPRERAAMYFHAGKLVVVGGSHENNSSGLPHVDVYDPLANSWTHTSPGFPPSTGFTISGSVRSGRAGFSSQAFIHATSSSGWDGQTQVGMQSGFGSYTIRGVPAGDTITLNAYLVDYGMTFPGSVDSGVDLGVIGPINADTTQDIDFPTNAVASLASGNVLFPGWTSGALFASPFQSRIGYPFLRAMNGIGEPGAGNSFALAYFPPAAPGQQDAMVGGQSSTPSFCEVSAHTLAAIAPGPLPLTTLLAPPRSLAPGLNECTPRGTAAQLAGAAVFQLGGGGSGMPSTPVAVAVRDVNNDGSPDLAVSNSSNGSVQLMFGQGNGTFTQGSQVYISGQPGGVALARLSGGTEYSLLVAARGGFGAVEIHQGDGQGGFSFNSSVTTGQDPYALITADLNRDGALDIVTTSPTDGTLSISPSNAFADFDPPYTVAACGGVHGLVSADFNRDGFQDLAVACQGSLPTFDNRVLVFRGVGVAPFVDSTNPIILATGVLASQPFALAAADVDGNGAPDLAATNVNGPTITLWRNQNGAAIGFQAPVGLGVGNANNGQGLAAADVNHDGLVDLVAASTGGHQVVVFRNDGAGAFSFLQTLGTPRGPLGLAAADLNGDSRTDVVVPCSEAGVIEVMLQTRPLTTSPEGAYTFTLPPGAGAIQLTRGPELQWTDWEYLVPVGAAATSMSITLPLPSTLAPAQPAPPGQIVGWSVQGFKGAFDINNLRFGLVRPTDRLQSGASLYIRQ